MAIKLDEARIRLLTIPAGNSMVLTAGKFSNLVAGSMNLYSNGIAISNPATANDVGFIRVVGTGESDTVLEIATGDDGGNSTAEKIVARQYNASNAIVREAVLLNTNGTTSFPVSVTSPSFIGALTGNVTGNASSSSKLIMWPNGATAANTPGLYLLPAGGATSGDTIDYNVDTPNTYSEAVCYGTILRIKYNNSSVYYTDIYSDTNNSALLYKTVTNGSSNGWVRILDSKNYTNWCDGRYVNTSGDTLTGALNFKNGTWNNVGDDAAMGDCNQAGMLGIKGLNGATGIYFTPYSGSTAQKISINGSGTMTITGTIASTFSGNLTGTASHATADAAGNVITSKYVAVDTTQTISGAKTFTAATRINNQLTINTSLQDHNTPTTQCLVLNSNGLTDTITEVTDKNAPGIGFHIRNVSWGSLIFSNTGFKFINNSATGYMNVTAAKFIGALQGNADTATVLQTARTLTIGNTGKSFNGGSNVAWTIREIGAIPHFIKTSATNADTLTITGYYSMKSGGDTNVPSTGHSMIFVDHDVGTPFQIYMHDTTNTIYKRYKNNTAGTWNAWSSTLGNSISGNAATATQLLNARTINGTSFNGTANITTANWGTARTLTIGNKGQSVNGSGNVSWTLHDILYSGGISSTTSWDITNPGAYYVVPVDNSTAYSGSGNPETNTLSAGTFYRYGQLIVSRANAGGTAQFYISHVDSADSGSYGIRFRTGWNNTYNTHWRILLDNINYTNWCDSRYVNTAGDTLTGALNFKNSTWNLVGDDAYFGDNDTAGSFAIKGANGNTNLKMVTQGGTTYSTITWDGSRFVLSHPLTLNAAGTWATTANYANALINLGTRINAESSGSYYYYPWFGGYDGVTGKGYYNTVTMGLYHGVPSTAGFFIGMSWDGANADTFYYFSRSGTFSANNVMVGGYQALHTNNYSSYALPKSGGTFTGKVAISYAHTGGGMFQLMSTNSNEASIDYAAGGTSYWVVGKGCGGTGNGTFAWYYVPGSKNVMTLTSAGALAITTLTTTTINMGGNINLSNMGTCYIGNGPSDASPTVGGALANLVISSWYGISFTTSCAVDYQNKTAIGFDCRTGTIRAAAVYGAVWNDYAEYRITTTKVKPGRVVVENNDDTLSMSTERLMPGANIVSDTFGFAIGETDDAQTPLAVSGRVLAYPLEPREEYCAGDPVCSGPNGTVSKMTREEVMMYPDRIVGTVSSVPNYDTWGTGNVKVNGRIWIKVR